MGLAYVLVGLISAAIAVFALQNNQSLSLRFIAWSLDDVPLAGAVLVSLAAGLILGAVPLAVANLRLRSRIRKLEAKTEMLEAALAPARDPAHLTPRSVPPPPSFPTSRSA